MNKPANGTTAIAERKPETPEGTILRLAFDQKMQARVKAILPRHVTPERFMAVFRTAVSHVPKLNECEPYSVIGGMVLASQMGLEVNTPQQHAWLVPFYNGQTKRQEAQLMLGYRGLLELASRAYPNASFYASEVYSNDIFHERRGTAQELVHEIVDYNDRGTFVGVYAVGEFPGRRPAFRFTPKSVIDKIRAGVKGSDSPYSPWTKWYDEMAIAKGFKRFCKWQRWPVERTLEDSPLTRAIHLDNMADANEQQRLATEAKLVQEKIGSAPTSLDDLAGDTHDAEFEPAHDDGPSEEEFAEMLKRQGNLPE